jgi:outer membrane lipoprotein carrier protein
MMKASRGDRTENDTPWRAGVWTPLLAAALMCLWPVSGFGASPDSESASSDSSRETTALAAEAVAERIQQFYRETEDFQANFKQVYTDVAAGETKTNWGRVYFKKPGRMRWDYYDTESLDERTKTLVSDGKIFWIYELKFDQVFKQCLSDNLLPTSLKFLMGQGDLLAEFDVSYTEDSTASAPTLLMKPKEPTSKYKKLHFQVDPESYQVVRTTVFDPYGNTNTIHFRNPKVNSNLPDSGFEFEPPKGARLLNKQKDCK